MYETKTEIGNLKNSDVEINAMLDIVDKEVVVVTAEEKDGDGECVKVCAGTTGRLTSKWYVVNTGWISSGVYTEVDISRCGYIKVPTITTSIHVFPRKLKHLLTDMSHRVEHQKLNQVAATWLSFWCSTWPSADTVLH